jgi:hypothetical protein
VECLSPRGERKVAAFSKIGANIYSFGPVALKPARAQMNKVFASFGSPKEVLS